MKNKRSTARRARPGLAERIAQGLTELRDAVRNGEPLEKQLTVHHLEVRSPGAYDSRAIRATRHRLGVSQSLFAQLLGVSVKQIEHLEQGRRFAQPTLRRLLDAVNYNPSIFLKHTKAA